MVETTRVAVFADGKLSYLAQKGRGREAVLALPLSRLLVKLVRIPVEKETELLNLAAEELKKISPFPDEALSPSCETVAETAEGKLVLAAALPESAAEDIGEALDQEKLEVTRIDAWVLGQLRELWAGLEATSTGKVRRLVLVKEAEGLALFVLDGDTPCAVRSLVNTADLKREALLSLLEAEDFGGNLPLKEIVAVGFENEAETAALATFGMVRHLALPEDAGLAGIQERAAEEGSLNAMPATWAEVVAETRLKRKLIKFLAIAGGVWLLAMAVLIGVPLVYDNLTNRQRAACRSHARAYEQVRDKKGQVGAVRNVSNHDLGALETLRLVSGVLPQGVELTKWNFKRGDVLSIDGTSETRDGVYKFREALAALSLATASDNEDDSETPFFKSVEYRGELRQRGQKFTFVVDCSFKEAEEE